MHVYLYYITTGNKSMKLRDLLNIKVSYQYCPRWPWLASALKASKALKLVKAISGTNWGQQKETILHTYKAYTRPILEYACPVWAPIDSQLLQHIKTTVNTKLSTQMCNRSHKRHQQQQLPHRNKSPTNQKTYTHDHIHVQRGRARLGTSSTWDPLASRTRQENEGNSPKHWTFHDHSQLW